ncbi:UNVERIFIED_CONTAM: hypothetical protein K2H54_035966 [Gekko kuhli]
MVRRGTPLHVWNAAVQRLALVRILALAQMFLSRADPREAEDGAGARMEPRGVWRGAEDGIRPARGRAWWWLALQDVEPEEHRADPAS